MDFLTASKASSIVLTGAFGVLGLIKDFKDKNGKITNWGRVSLAGILLSTGLGVIMQLVESSRAEQAQKETAAQTLGIVRDIQRGLSPLEEPIFNLRFSQDCGFPGYAQFCEAVTATKNLPIDDLSEWKSWPWGPPNRVSLFLEVHFFVDPKEAELYENDRKRTGNLWFQLRPTTFDHSLTTTSQGGVVYLDADVKTFGYDNSGEGYGNGSNKLKSILDMPGVTGVVVEFTRELGVRPLVSFGMRFKNGQSFSFQGPFEHVHVAELPAYRFKVPAPDQY